MKIAVLTLAVVVLAGCGSSGPERPASTTATTTNVQFGVDLRGTRGVSIKTDGTLANAECAGAGRFEDLAAGTPLTVVDAEGHVLARAVLDSGHYAPPLDTCAFSVLTSVEEGHGAYGIRVDGRPTTALVPEARFFSNQAAFSFKG